MSTSKRRNLHRVAVPLDLGARSFQQSQHLLHLKPRGVILFVHKQAQEKSIHPAWFQAADPPDRLRNAFQRFAPEKKSGPENAGARRRRRPRGAAAPRVTRGMLILGGILSDFNAMCPQNKTGIIQMPVNLRSRSRNGEI